MYVYKFSFLPKKVHLLINLIQVLLIFITIFSFLNIYFITNKYFPYELWQK